LFILFDITGSRSQEGQHQKARAATRRADKRKGNIKDAKGKRGSHNGTIAAEPKPTLDEELKTFKAIVRHIAKYEPEPEVIRWFQADNRPSLRRLGNLGINGHQPAIAAYCKMTGNEKEKVADAIMQQKVANNPKAEKQLAEHRERRKQDRGSKIIIRIARVAVGASVRWQRKLTQKNNNGTSIDESNCTCEQAKRLTRMLACTRCGMEQETKDKQLKISAGFRAIHCKNCRKQERVFRNKCSCKVIWHQCPHAQNRPTFPQLQERQRKKEKGPRRTGKKGKAAKLAQASTYNNGWHR